MQQKFLLLIFLFLFFFSDYTALADTIFYTDKKRGPLRVKRSFYNTSYADMTDRDIDPEMTYQPNHILKEKPAIHINIRDNKILPATDFNFEEDSGTFIN